MSIINKINNGNPIINETSLIIVTSKELTKIEEHVNMVEKHLPIGTVLNDIDSTITAISLDSIKKSIAAIRRAL